jgi:hypothetical protein
VERATDEVRKVKAPSGKRVRRYCRPSNETGAMNEWKLTPEQCKNLCRRFDCEEIQECADALYASQTAQGVIPGLPVPPVVLRALLFQPSQMQAAVVFAVCGLDGLYRSELSDGLIGHCVDYQHPGELPEVCCALAGASAAVLEMVRRSTWIWPSYLNEPKDFSFE